MPLKIPNVKVFSWKYREKKFGENFKKTDVIDPVRRRQLNASFSAAIYGKAPDLNKPLHKFIDNAIHIFGCNTKFVTGLFSSGCEIRVLHIGKG